MSSREHFSIVLTQMFDDQKYCSVKFSCPDDNASSSKSTIGAHKLILSISSEVFLTMFYGTMAQTNEGQIVSVIDIPDVTISVFKLMLGFMYGKTITFGNIEVASDFYYAVDKYNCKDAQEFVSGYMISELNTKNVIFIYESTILYNDSKLSDACLKIFGEETDEILESDEFLSAKPDTIETIFKLNSLSLHSEMELISALERYIMLNKNNDLQIAEKVRPALNCIRFLTLTRKELKKIKYTTLLTQEEAFNIIASLESEDDLTKMPSGLSTNRTKRHFVLSEMIRSLSGIYSSKMCYACVKYEPSSSYYSLKTDHAIWTCGHTSKSQTKNLKDIFEKYEHDSLIEYDCADLKCVYDIYKRLGQLKI